LGRGFAKTAGNGQPASYQHNDGKTTHIAHP
jgi:hypothetical protein